MRRTQLLCNSWGWSKIDSDSTLKPNYRISSHQSMKRAHWKRFLDRTWFEKKLTAISFHLPTTPLCLPKSSCLEGNILASPRFFSGHSDLKFSHLHNTKNPVLKHLISFYIHSLKTAEDYCRISDVCLFDLNTAWSFGFQVKHLFNHHSNTTPPSCAFTRNNGTLAETKIQCYI